ncbi:hypothetical protein [Sphingomonas sp. BK235]|uniref:hypothetical protein n=1 Tax=Sphingomonas sp. BK235 TaxID=2512131 RepID=UPI00104A7524|nr:hypothetical protein [Sphingomonas sp. BK235]TCP34985.1 hypothetical protein EV292_103415 [Sphingomonas sp. BK235]
MRTVPLSLLPLLLAACGGEGGGNQTAPAPSPTGPAPKTPVMDITPVPGNEAEWMEPRDAPDAPPSAPYANLLDQPVVKGPPAR